MTKIIKGDHMSKEKKIYLLWLFVYLMQWVTFFLGFEIFIITIIVSNLMTLILLHKIVWKLE
jgi:hypothetical protein